MTINSRLVAISTISPATLKTGTCRQVLLFAWKSMRPGTLFSLQLVTEPGSGEPAEWNNPTLLYQSPVGVEELEYAITIACPPAQGDTTSFYWQLWNKNQDGSGVVVDVYWDEFLG